LFFHIWMESGLELLLRKKVNVRKSEPISLGLPFCSFARKSQNTETMLGMKLQPGDVVEIHGAEGSGKTQMAYHAALMTAMPQAVMGGELQLHGRERAVVCFDLDYRFRVERLAQLFDAHINRCCRTQNIDVTRFLICPEYQQQKAATLKRIYITHCQTSTELLAAIGSLRRSVPRGRGPASPLKLSAQLGLLIVDNVSAHFWEKRASGMRVSLRRSASSYCRSMHSSSSEQPFGHHANKKQKVGWEGEEERFATTSSSSSSSSSLSSEPSSSSSSGCEEESKVSAAAEFGQNTKQQMTNKIGRNSNTKTETDIYYFRVADMLKQIVSVPHSEAVVLVTKPALFQKSVQELAEGFHHQEYLGKDWRKFVKYRLLLRPNVDHASPSFSGRVECNFPTSASSPYRNWQFRFRVSNEGIASAG